MRRLTAAMVGALCILAGQTGLASADTHDQRWLVLTRPGEPTHVVATGTVTASGTVIDVLTLNPDGTFDNFATQVFPDGNLMPPILDAVRAYATVGEISDRLRVAWGEHRELITV